MAGYAETVAYWQSFPIKTVSDLEQRLDNFRVLFAYHSGKIENEEITLHDTREIFENGKVLNYTGSPRAIFEQQNQKLCYEFLKEKIAAKEPLTQELVLEVHRILTSGTYDERRFLENGERPGEYKKHDYITGRNEAGAPADRVAEDMADLLEDVYKNPPRDEPMGEGFTPHFNLLKFCALAGVHFLYRRGWEPKKVFAFCPPLANFAQRIYGYVDKAHVTPEQVEAMTARIRPYVK